MAYVPIGTLDQIRKINYNFLWKGSKEDSSPHWITWKNIAWPKEVGGWGLNSPFCFAKALTVKGVWCILRGEGCLQRFNCMYAALFLPPRSFNLAPIQFHFPMNFIFSRNVFFPTVGWECEEAPHWFGSLFKL